MAVSNYWTGGVEPSKLHTVDYIDLNKYKVRNENTINRPIDTSVVISQGEVYGKTIWECETKEVDGSKVPVDKVKDSLVTGINGDLPIFFCYGQAASFPQIPLGREGYLSGLYEKDDDDLLKRMGRWCEIEEKFPSSAPRLNNGNWPGLRPEQVFVETAGASNTFQPIVGYKYENMKTLIMVAATNKKDRSAKDFRSIQTTFKDWDENHRYTYPYVIGIYFCGYIRNTDAATSGFVQESSVAPVTIGKIKLIPNSREQENPVIESVVPLTIFGGANVYGLFESNMGAWLGQQSFFLYANAGYQLMPFAYENSYWGYFSNNAWTNPLTCNVQCMNQDKVIKEDVLKAACKVNCIICLSREDALSPSVLGDDTYIPKLDENGKPTGEYTNGKDNAKAAQLSPGYDPFAFNPKKDDNEYTPKVDTDKKPKNSPIGHFNRTFALSNSQLEQLVNKLYTGDSKVWNQIVEGLNLHGANPIEALIDLRLYPFDVTQYCGATTQTITLGRTNLGISGRQIDKDASCVIDMGSCTFPYASGNSPTFLDAEPYTTASLYIPYCGVTPIPVATFAGRTISVEIIVDLITGCCTGVIYCDNIAWNYVNGQIGISIPMTSTDSATYASNMLNATIQAGASAAGLMTAAAGQSWGGAVQAGLGLVNSAVSINDNVNNYHLQSAGSPSSGCSNNTPPYCYFCIQRSLVKTESIASFRHNVGHACAIPGTINNRRGFSVFSNVEYNGGGTDTEKAMIIQYLTSGVYL